MSDFYANLTLNLTPNHNPNPKRNPNPNPNPNILLSGNSRKVAIFRGGGKNPT